SKDFVFSLKPLITRLVVFVSYLLWLLANTTDKESNHIVSNRPFVGTQKETIISFSFGFEL
ncbi:hypothetical protein, partial [Streptococcus dysgalactiae]|uniref:hypothetical protein n=2 Tax=Streptococcus dysgalactiae TaxID=1334 RepID=UPI002283CE5B